MLDLLVRPTSLRRFKVLKRALMVALVLGAILIGLVALQSMSGVHGFTGLTSPTTQSRTHAEGAEAHAPAAAAQHPGDVSSTPVAQNMTCDGQCAVDCALMAMMCVMVLLITALILLAKYPSVHYRMIELGQRAVQAVAAARQHVYLPSLTVLSISRT